MYKIYGLIGLNLVLVVIYMIIALMVCFINSSWDMINPLNWYQVVKIWVCVINFIVSISWLLEDDDYGFGDYL